MKPFWLSAFVAMIVAAFLAVPSAAQKGKGGGNGAGKGAGKGGSFTPPGKSNAQHSGPGHSETPRPVDHPNSGNTKEPHDKSPQGRHDTPEKQPGAAHHVQKSDDAKEHVDPSKHPSKPLPTTETKAARPFDHPKSGNSLPQDVKDKLPPGLRDKPDNHPGLANHLRKMGVLNDHPAVDPIPPSVRSQLPPGLRDRPYDHPGVANHLGKLGWSINDDGALVPPTNWTPPALTPQAFTPQALTPQALKPLALMPPSLTPSPLTPSALFPSALTPPVGTPPAVTPPTPNATPFDSFQPFGGFFRRR
jgi:hypothetical protein